MIYILKTTHLYPYFGIIVDACELNNTSLYLKG